jgi:D-alanyl-D-alanine carboxypeptidase/D-alanyl-D-alanine-endopeptidase (penicillin-binding protein 4)
MEHGESCLEYCESSALLNDCHPPCSRPRVCSCPLPTRGQNFKLMRHLFGKSAFIFLLSLIVFDVPAQEAKPVKTLADLQQQLSAHLAQSKFDAALWGVKVVALDSGKVVFEQNSQKLFSPASNSKLYTVALALDCLGSDYRIKTSLYAAARPNSGVLKGDLIVFGRGDPTINARLRNNDIYAALQPLVAALTNAGVQRITGDLIGDDSYFQGPPYGSGWAWDDMESYYGAEISALTINDNTLRVSVKPGATTSQSCSLALSPSTTYIAFSNRTETATNAARRSINFYRPMDENVVYATGKMPLDSRLYSDDVTVHNPAGLFIWFFKEALTRHGIKVDGKLRTVNWLDRQVDPIHIEKLVELGSAESLPMSDIAREVMKPSQNLYTDLLLAHIGEQHRASQTSPNETSEELGIRELNKFLTEAGIKKGDVFFEEGSGLSRNNLTTPNATIALLQYMSHHKCAEPYLNALPIAGVDGTLRKRMKGTAAEGNVRAKTGTLRWADSLSGHVNTAAGERLLFSLMLNRYHKSDPDRSARADVDAIAVMLAEFNGRVAN